MTAKLSLLCGLLFLFGAACDVQEEDAAQAARALESRAVPEEVLFGPTGCDHPGTSTTAEEDAGTEPPTTPGDDGVDGMDKCWPNSSCSNLDNYTYDTCRSCLNGSSGLKSWRGYATTTCITNQSRCP